MKKWRNAAEETPGAQEGFHSITATSDPNDVRVWSRMAKEAAEQRRQNIKVMDIYDMSEDSRKYSPPLLHDVSSLSLGDSAHKKRDRSGADERGDQTPL